MINAEYTWYLSIFKEKSVVDSSKHLLLGDLETPYAYALFIAKNMPRQHQQPLVGKRASGVPAQINLFLIARWKTQLRRVEMAPDKGQQR